MKLKTMMFAISAFLVVIFAVYLSGISSIPTEALSDKSNPPTELRQYTVVTTTKKTKKGSKPKMVEETTTTKKSNTNKPKEKKKKHQQTTTAATTTTTQAPTKIFPDSDLEMMAIVIYREAGGDAASNKTRIMVGNVVMNRVRSRHFPNTIYGVLTQRGQYAGVHGAVTWPSRASNRWEKEAVKRAWACARRVQAGENYLPANVVYQSNYRNLGSGVYCVANDMYFNYY